MTRTESIWQRFDYVLFGITILLIIFGILMIRSATQGAIDPALISRVPDQIQFAFVGLALMLALSFMDYRLFNGLHTWLYLLMVVLLVMVFFLGVEGDAGAQSWINIGIRIQPSEVAKVLIIITLGHFLATHYQNVGSLSTIFASLVHMGIPALLIFIQPDLGMVTVFAAIWMVMIWASGLRLKHIALFALVLTVSAPLIWSQMAEYQQKRITTFINPESDEAGYYNIRQALISIGSGGTVGKGYSVGSQNKGRFLRVRHTDFIFSVIAEEFGMVGGSLVMGLIGVVLIRILHGARTAVDPFGSLICYGVAAFIFFQTVTSIGMNLGLLPVTGLTLPFISSGGTSLLSTMAGIGLAQSVIARRRRI
ncbi:MAG: rod shape-determining protein RodA [Anaerolineae bacterium]|nr:rod shape-determining protein RodA [Anaerolineae bacterium]